MAPTPIISSISLPSIEINSTTTSRARTQRKRINDDAAYFGPPPPGAIGVKRHAIDKADGEPRVKRKKLDAPNSNGNGIGKRMVDRVSVLEGGDSNVSLVRTPVFSPAPAQIRHRSISKACLRRHSMHTSHNMISYRPFYHLHSPHMTLYPLSSSKISPDKAHMHHPVLLPPPHPPTVLVESPRMSDAEVHGFSTTT